MNIQTITRILRISLYILIFLVTLKILITYSNPNTLNKSEVVSSLISMISIIVAIIITYLFSKLFSEKSIKVERKKEIDELSLKITYLRRMAFHIRSMHEFWKFEDINVKGIIDYSYPNLTLEEFRGQKIKGHTQFSYDELNEIGEKIYGTAGQAYLALKGLEDGENSFAFFTEFNPKNYSLEDVARFKEYTSFIWSFMDRADPKIVNFKGVHKHWLNYIDELYYKITGTSIKQDDYLNSIKELLTKFESEIFEKHYFLTSLNSDNFPLTFRRSYSNMLIFVILLVLTVFHYVISFNSRVDFIGTLTLLGIFITNTLDLVIITFNSIRTELDVKDIFKI